MKKRNCRMSEQERGFHERAVKIRKMTDEQLCRFVDGLYDRGLQEGKKVIQPQKNISRAFQKNAVASFVLRLDTMSGTGNGIGKATVSKIKKFAEEEGFVGL